MKSNDKLHFGCDYLLKLWFEKYEIIMSDRWNIREYAWIYS